MSSSASSEEAAKLVNDLIGNHHVVIFGRPTCPACKYTKSIMDSACHGVLPEDQLKVVDKDSLGALQPHVTSHLNRVTGQNYIPNIFIGGKTVGYKETVAAYKAGTLRQMVSKEKPAASR